MAWRSPPAAERGWPGSISRLRRCARLASKHGGWGHGGLPVGDLAATGLNAGSADVVLCVDAIHSIQQPDAAYREIHCILTVGGRTVLTCWEPWTGRTSGCPNDCGGSMR